MKSKLFAAVLLGSFIILASFIFIGRGSDKVPYIIPLQGDQIVKELASNESFEMLTKNIDNPDFSVIDLRSKNEFKKERIFNAFVINFHTKSFKEEILSLDKNKTYLIYCKTGRYAKITSEIMKENGFLRVYNIQGGIDLWKKLGYSIIKG